MNISAILGRDVMDLSTATTVGRVDDVVVDPASRRVTAFQLVRTTGDSTWLPYPNLSALGADALTISDAAKLTGTPSDAPIGIVKAKALGGRVLTDQGREIGPLQDIEIDDDGALTALATAGGTIDADRLLGIGAYAVVVADVQASP